MVLIVSVCEVKSPLFLSMKVSVAKSADQYCLFGRFDRSAVAFAVCSLFDDDDSSEYLVSVEASFEILPINETRL